MTSAIGVAGAGGVVTGALGGVATFREFHMAIAAIASASTAIAGSRYERMPEGAGGLDAGGPEAGIGIPPPGVGIPVTGSGVATGGSGIGGGARKGLFGGGGRLGGGGRAPAGGIQAPNCRAKNAGTSNHPP